MKWQSSPDTVSASPIARKFASLVELPRCLQLAESADFRRIAIFVFLISIVAVLDSSCASQSLLPFEVSNSRNQKWPAEEAGRIYFSACELVARAIRPEKPPHLHPRFVLVLGAHDNETVRNGAVSEIHLKTWNSGTFAQAVVIMAAREILKGDEVANLTRDTLISAQASVSWTELKRKQ